MPERIIDAIGKADATSWNAIHLSKGSPNLLRIISGQLSRMPAGEVMSAVVEKAAKGAFKIKLNGEMLIIKGLPATLLGKAVSFVAKQTLSTGKNSVDLFWLGPSREKSTSAGATAHQGRPRAGILSGLSAEMLAHIKSGKIMAGKIDHIQAGKMTVNLSAPEPKKPGKIDHIQTGKMAANLSAPEPKKPHNSVIHQIQTAAIKGFQAGQTILVRVQAGMNSKPEMEILPQQAMHQDIAKIAGKAAAPAMMASFKMVAGEVATAMVQKRLSDGRVQLKIQGVIVETPAPETVAKGDILMLRMTKPPAEFQLLSVQKNTAAKMISVLKSNLPVSHEPLTQNLTAIRNLLPALAIADLPEIAGLPQLQTWMTSSESTQKQPVNGEQLAQLIRESGTGLETKLLNLSQQAVHHPAILQDLKTLMLQLSNARSSNANHAKMIKVLSELGQHSAARIETTQALNVLAHMQGDPIRFEFPMLVGQQLVNVYMSFQQQGQQQATGDEAGELPDQTYSVLFALEMSGLGKLKVDASISDSTVHARIYSDQSAVGQFIREHIQRLESRLQDIGYKEVFLLTSHMPPDAEKQRSFDQLTNMAPASLNLLDIIA